MEIITETWDGHLLGLQYLRVCHLCIFQMSRKWGEGSYKMGRCLIYYSNQIPCGNLQHSIVSRAPGRRQLFSFKQAHAVASLWKPLSCAAHVVTSMKHQTETLCLHLRVVCCNMRSSGEALHTESQPSPSQKRNGVPLCNSECRTRTEPNRKPELNHYF